MKRISPLFRIDLYKDNVLYKSYKKIIYRDIETYIRGVLGVLESSLIIDMRDDRYEGVAGEEYEGRIRAVNFGVLR